MTVLTGYYLRPVPWPEFQMITSSHFYSLAEGVKMTQSNRLKLRLPVPTTQG